MTENIKDDDQYDILPQPVRIITLSPLPIAMGVLIFMGAIDLIGYFTLRNFYDNIPVLIYLLWGFMIIISLGWSTFIRYLDRLPRCTTTIHRLSEVWGPTKRFSIPNMRWLLHDEDCIENFKSLMSNILTGMSVLNLLFCIYFFTVGAIDWNYSTRPEETNIGGPLSLYILVTFIISFILIGLVWVYDMCGADREDTPFMCSSIFAYLLVLVLIGLVKLVLYGLELWLS